MRGLLSVSDKTGLLDLARGLAARGWELVSTGGTAQVLGAAGLPVTSVSVLTGSAEMLDGRVKTLHPAIHGGILARRDRTEDLDALARQRIGLIDLVAVNLYPFRDAAARADLPVEALLEQIDIGGPALVRAAAKNFRDVLVLVDAADYVETIRQLDQPGGPTLAFRLALARKAFEHTAAYDATIAAALQGVTVADRTWVREPLHPEELMPDRLTPRLSKLRELRYGENPHQRAAWYADDTGAGFGRAQILQGKDLSFTNLLDLDAAVRLAFEFEEPAAALIKHTNPCGVATGTSLSDAYVRARDTDPLSAFGGIVGLNRPVDPDTARAVTSTFIEAVVAPAVDEQARSILATKSSMRVVTVDVASGLPSAAPERVVAARRDLRSILGAVLVQERDGVPEAARRWPDGPGRTMAAGLRIATTRVPTGEEWEALRFAWRVCAHVKSNAVVFTRRDHTVAIGAGQMSRVDAVQVAVLKGGHLLVGSVAASDAFFPFRDGLDAIAAAGATAVVQPGGSVRDAEVIAAADEHGLAMVFTGRRHFRH